MKQLLLLLFSLASLQVSAQHEYDVWYFGSQAGINFISGAPVNLTNGQIYTTEGSSSVSDSAGNLLFYTDGVTVWNKNHTMMANGNGLFGGASTSQSALIIRRPGSDSLYYIFTVGQAGSYGLTYSIVDITLQSGLGEVIVKNTGLVISLTEKLTSVLHSNGSDYWVIVHDLNSKNFYSFQLSASGVNAVPVTSTVGLSHNWEIGCMKGSHDGTQLAVGVQYGNFFQLLDFNSGTGEVTNPITLTCPPTAFGPYGIEFSPSDDILYATAYSGPCVILQWDITSNDSATINNSRIAIDSSSASNIGSLQLASDGKIYMAKYGEPYLGVINNPDVYGFGCNYDDFGFNLSPKSSQLGLPNIPPKWISGPVVNSPNSAFNASDTAVCEKFCIDFFDQTGNNPTSWQWEFEQGIPSTSSQQNPTDVCYDVPGVYDVTLITTNSFGSDTLVIPNHITVYATPPFPVITQNGNILTSSPADFYQWQLNAADIPGATNQSYTITQSGFYTVVITDLNGCVNSSSADVLFSGIEDEFQNASVLVYPNPSDGNFVIEISGKNISEKPAVKIFNAIGQCIFSAKATNDSASNITQIQLSTVANGIYLVEMEWKDEILRQKIVITH